MTEHGWPEIQPAVEALQQQLAVNLPRIEVYVRDVDIVTIEPPDRLLVCVVFEFV
jgi:hypothetical protein